MTIQIKLPNVGLGEPDLGFEYLIYLFNDLYHFCKTFPKFCDAFVRSLDVPDFRSDTPANSIRLPKHYCCLCEKGHVKNNCASRSFHTIPHIYNRLIDNEAVQQDDKVFCTFCNKSFCFDDMFNHFIQYDYVKVCQLARMHMVSNDGNKYDIWHNNHTKKKGQSEFENILVNDHGCVGEGGNNEKEGVQDREKCNAGDENDDIDSNEGTVTFLMKESNDERSQLIHRCLLINAILVFTFPLSCYFRFNMMLMYLCLSLKNTTVDVSCTNKEIIKFYKLFFDSSDFNQYITHNHSIDSLSHWNSGGVEFVGFDSHSGEWESSIFHFQSEECKNRVKDVTILEEKLIKKRKNKLMTEETMNEGREIKCHFSKGFLRLWFDEELEEYISSKIKPSRKVNVQNKNLKTISTKIQNLKEMRLFTNGFSLLDLKYYIHHSTNRQSPKYNVKVNRFLLDLIGDKGYVDVKDVLNERMRTRSSCLLLPELSSKLYQHNSYIEFVLDDKSEIVIINIMVIENGEYYLMKLYHSLEDLNSAESKQQHLQEFYKASKSDKQATLCVPPTSIISTRPYRMLLSIIYIVKHSFSFSLDLDGAFKFPDLFNELQLLQYLKSCIFQKEELDETFKTLIDQIYLGELLEK